VLVIDDDRKLCRLIRDHLEPMGHEVSAAHSGTDGVERAVGEAWDAVILDVMPPESLSKLFDPFLSRGQLADAADGRSGFESGDCSNLRGSVWRSVRARNRESGGLKISLYLAEAADPRCSSG